MIVDTDKILLPAEGGEHSITISTNTKFTVSTNANWLSTSIEKGDLDDRLIVGAQVNKTNNTRDAKLTISYATKCIDILISQSCSEDTFWGDVILNNLEDVKSFGGKGYKVINGNFIVEHTSLQQLGNTIEHVEGNVSLQLSSYNIWQQREYNCDGLYGLKTIGGSLIIDWISNPNQLEGLNNIQSVGKNVTITTSTGVEGLNNLKHIGGDLIFNVRGSLTISGFNSLEFVDGSLIMDNEIIPKIVHVSLSGLNSLKTINGDMFFNYIAFNANNEYLPSLERIAGDVSFEECINVSNVADNLKSVGKNISCFFDTEHYSNSEDSEYRFLLSDDYSFKIFPSLTTTGGNISLTFDSNEACGSKIQSIEAFNNLSNVGGAFVITIDDYNIKSISLNNLESVSSCYITSSMEIGSQIYLNLNQINFPRLRSVDNDFVIGGRYFSRFNGIEIDYYDHLEFKESLVLCNI